MEKMLPFNPKAEEGVLSSIMIDPECMSEIVDTLSPADFYRNTHRVLYTTLLSLYRQQIASDSLTVCDELERTNQMEHIEGGMSYVYSLINFESVTMNVEHYASIVKRDAQCRRVIHAATQMVALAYDRDEQVVEKAEDLLFQVSREVTRSSFTSMPDLMDTYMQELNVLHEHKGRIIGVPTGFTDMDTLLCGLQKTDLVILAGRPGTGKTSLAMNIVENAAEYKNGVAVFSLEMGERQLARRLMSMKSGVDLQSLRSGWISDEQWEPITRAMRELSSLNIWINDASGNPIASMRAQLRRLLQHTKLDLVVVDYLQLIDSSDESKGNKNRAEEISEIARGLKRLAKEFDVPVLALAQLSRAVETRANKHPQLSDLKESGGIEENADVVMFVYREDYYAAMDKREDYSPTNIAEITVAKHRNGEVGDISLYFKADQTKFFNLGVMVGGN